MVIHSGKTQAQVARELGCSEYSLTLWKKALIFHVSDVDGFWAYLMEKGFYPDSKQDASWGEPYFHMPDPDGHKLSFARPF
jgi:uncharacterized glyoxalase superfamily protein PhnB